MTAWEISPSISVINEGEVSCPLPYPTTLHGRGGIRDVPLYVPPNLYTNLRGRTLSGGDTTTNPPMPADDYFVLGNGRYTPAFDGANTVTVQ